MFKHLTYSFYFHRIENKLPPIFRNSFKNIFHRSIGNLLVLNILYRIGYFIRSFAYFTRNIDIISQNIEYVTPKYRRLIIQAWIEMCQKFNQHKKDVVIILCWWKFKSIYPLCNRVLRADLKKNPFVLSIPFMLKHWVSIAHWMRLTISLTVKVCTSKWMPVCLCICVYRETFGCIDWRLIIMNREIVSQIECHAIKTDLKRERLHKMKRIRMMAISTATTTKRPEQ